MARTVEFFTLEDNVEKRKIVITEDQPVERVTSIEEMRKRVDTIEGQINHLIKVRNELIDEINEVSSSLVVEIVDPLPYKSETKMKFINEKGETVEESKATAEVAVG